MSQIRRSESTMEHLFPVPVVSGSTDQLASDVRIGSAEDGPPSARPVAYFAMFYNRAAVRIGFRISAALVRGIKIKTFNIATKSVFIGWTWPLTHDHAPFRLASGSATNKPDALG